MGQNGERGNGEYCLEKVLILKLLPLELGVERLRQKESRSHSTEKSLSLSLCELRVCFTLSSMMDHGNDFSGSGSGTNKRSSNESNDRKKPLMSRQIVYENEKDDINKMADAFINNCRKQLKIERENSFKHFQDMINRGA
ncbi:hypothetical protein GLYMA_05G154900v4 [Glycine max]|nr:uncharacterized protein LOC102660563 [Glycine max]KAG4391298.1 hypothetical protein GLYMA_05G154900v4 [Glycine max]KAH1134588.1 hypothetical protein GYH30_012772 [Glycine max]RZC12614.1 hypothetical protein D0Y65_012404 [Glycine soja]|eukprot:XP_006580155.1 uncharacterized protein LOC102660563 [Glycine max]